MLAHCGSFSIGPCKPLPICQTQRYSPRNRPLKHFNQWFTCRAPNSQASDSHGNSCLMTVDYSIFSRNQQAMSFFVCSLESPEELYHCHSASVYLQVNIAELARDSGQRSLLLKKPQCENIDKQIESTLNYETPLVWPPAATNMRPGRLKLFWLWLPNCASIGGDKMGVGLMLESLIP